ncbi:MAG: ABC transporter ATP-binding protein [Clostridia bacterium]|nr:ABC transporter ATP-binding protein [Clostridia bacterium]
MIHLQKTPAAVTEYLRSRTGLYDSGILLMRADLGADLVKKDVWVMLCPEVLIVAEGSIEISRGADRRDGAVAVFKETLFASYPVKDLTAFKMEEQLSGGILTCKQKEEPLALFNYTGLCKHDVRILRDALSELAKEGTVDEKKLEETVGELPFCPKCGRQYPDHKRKVCQFCVDKKRLVKQLSFFFMRYKSYMLLIILSIGLVTGVGLLVPQISSKMFYNEVLTEGGKYYGKLLLVVGLIFGVRLLSMLFNMLYAIIAARVSTRVNYDLKKTIYEAVTRLSLNFFSSRQTGGLMTQINSDANTIYWFFCDGFPYIITNGLQLIGVIVIMLVTNPVLTLYTFVTVPVFFILYRSLFKMFSKLHAKRFSKQRSMSSLVSDVLSGMRVVKTFAREDLEKGRFARRNADAADAEMGISVTSAKTFPFLGFLLQTGSFVVWAIGGRQVIESNGSMSYGDLMAFVAYISMVYSPINFFADVANWWTDCLNALQRLFEIKDASPDVAEKDGAVTLEELKGDVEFENVSFSYEEGREVIKNVSFKVPHGTTLGIVGHTGAGKSTLANLLTRLYDPNAGTIKIDGVDLKELSFKALRGSIAIVSQETYLFRGTIMDNIRYAKPQASEEEVIAAAKAASAHDFIIKYPDGYQTMVGFGKKDLSGGEKQRVSIARALLTDPKILILDEATAAMDTQTERQIQAALNAVTQGRTTIIIAHRLSTLREADSLIVVEKGEVVERGTATELLKAQGVYYRLYKLQAEALKTVGIE